MKSLNEYLNESSNIEINFKQTRKGERKDVIIVNNNKETFEVHYPADEYDTPYGILLPNEDVILFINKDKRAKKLYNKYKSDIDNFLNNVKI
jgi:hypothetical protein